MKIAIVGPCAAGKTTLAKKLIARGYDAHDIAQEHSDVPAMWREITKPNVVIYLDASLETIRARLNVDWDADYRARLISRLRDVRGNADLILETDALDEGAVFDRVEKFLRARI